MKNKRIEVDLLGEKEIDADSYYGIHTRRAIDNFRISNSKIGDYPVFIEGLILTKKACAFANKEIGTIPAANAELVIQACDEILGNLAKYVDCFPSDVFQGWRRDFCQHECQRGHCECGARNERAS